MEMKNSFIKGIIDKMTPEQKIGAVLTLGFAGTVVRPHIYDYINKYHCGGLRLTPHSREFGNYVDPKTGKTIVDLERSESYKKGAKVPPYCTASEYKEILDGFQEMARNRPLGIPLHFSYDQEGSENANFCFGGVNLFTKPMGIRATGDKRYAYEVAKAVGRQGKAVGFSWVHSPVLDVNTDPRNPEIGIRSYSDDPEVVAEYAEQALLGFKAANIIATGKHFPGRGQSAIDAHFELDVINVDRQTMLDRELLPYKRLIAKGILPSIMIAHSVFPAFDSENIATVSKKILTGLLRDELGFEGVITTDSMTMGSIATKYGVPQACAMALEAGADLVLMKAENALVDQTIAAIKESIDNGKLTYEELDKKIYRILSLKYEYGLFHAVNDNHTAPELTLNDPDIKTLSKEVGKKSVMVLRDRDGLIALPTDEKILVVEQSGVDRFNDLNMHSGMLYENCLKYNRNVGYIETAFDYDADDKAKIEKAIERYDTVVFTNYFFRGHLANTEYIRDLIKKGNKKVVLVTNTPYPMTIPDEAGTVVITYSCTKHNIETVGQALFGKVVPQGEWPLEGLKG